MSEIASATAVSRGRRADAVRNASAIVDAASRVLAENPSASVQDVAVACGLHRATVHRHFASRDELIHAVRIQAFRETQVEVERLAADESLAPMAALEKIALALFDVGDRYRIYRFTTMLGPGIDDERADVHAPIAVVIKRAQKAGELRKDITGAMHVAAFGGLVFGMLPEIAAGTVGQKKAARIVMSIMRGV
ncbi:TetR family transcriptional regulator [Conexibacter sp. W3-3-2]|uniref:HTH tetR-type domain-containing protein n=1 Tax=Paraconexibacter algicola TaxID=2133960 RepID=A0A2T4UHH6_9ACTN|nr:MULTISPECIES: TetR/AcrR family transcriptional regulator [Solirubrobacterales]MTD44999.1 TetR family transcriptional regulator [Conexibacter sp. W3-3-2]PTL58702.1 hypothetical protein C7Y72_03075 [Paraconexibacter algicola]